MLLLLVPVGLATVIGLLVMWPDGEPTRAQQVAATAGGVEAHHGGGDQPGAMGAQPGQMGGPGRQSRGQHLLSVIAFNHVPHGATCPLPDESLANSSPAALDTTASGTLPLAQLHATGL